MNAGDIRKFILSRPFQPYEILLVDGRKFRVDHPDFIFAPPVPSATWVLLVNPDGSAEQLNTLVISGVRVAAPKTPRRLRKAG